MNSKELEEVLAAAKSKKKFFMEGLWTRFFPVVQKIKSEIENKTIGDLMFFSGNFFVPIKDSDRLNKKELGGGACLE